MNIQKNNTLLRWNQQSAQKEDALFYNLDNTQDARPPDYPEDNTTTPNAAIAKLNGNDLDKGIGPSIILKAMVIEPAEIWQATPYRQRYITCGWLQLHGQHARD